MLLTQDTSVGEPACPSDVSRLCAPLGHLRRELTLSAGVTLRH